jgi:hypothetical protein
MVDLLRIMRVLIVLTFIATDSQMFKYNLRICGVNS